MSMYDEQGRIQVCMIRCGCRVRTGGGSVVKLDRPKKNGAIRCFHEDGREDEISRESWVKILSESE